MIVTVRCPACRKDHGLRVNPSLYHLAGTYKCACDSTSEFELEGKRASEGSPPDPFHMGDVQVKKNKLLYDGRYGG